MVRRMPASLLVATVCLALFTSACGRSPASQVAQVGSSTVPTRPAPNPRTAPAPGGGALAFSQCMRAHGVSNFPDPMRSGTPFDKSVLYRLASTDPAFRSASRRCQHLFPSPPAARRRAAAAQALAFSHCMRTHGVSTFPDPGSDGRIPDPATVGLDQGSPRFEAANHACRKDRPPYVPSNASYNAWAAAHGT